jgi:hypothetical protein
MSGHRAKIRIENDAGYSLKALDVYEWFGYTAEPPRDVPANSTDTDFRGGIYQGTWGIAAGTSGLVCYELRLAQPAVYLVIFWSVPKLSARRNHVSVEFFGSRPNLYDVCNDMFHNQPNTSVYNASSRNMSVLVSVTLFALRPLL